MSCGTCGSNYPGGYGWYAYGRLDRTEQGPTTITSHYEMYGEGSLYICDRCVNKRRRSRLVTAFACITITIVSLTWVVPWVNEVSGARSAWTWIVPLVVLLVGGYGLHNFFDALNREALLDQLAI